MTSSCILGNLVLRAFPFIRQVTAGCKHNSARFDEWLENLAMEDLTPKQRRPELQREH